MATSPDRTKACDPATRAGRLVKARQFMDAAHMIETLADEAGDIADAYVTLCVHAGIAAADVICCARLGRHARGDDHGSAVELLERTGPDAARHLRTLLSMKTKAGYTAIPVSGSEHTRAGRAARALVDAAEQI
jgi:hypothetical protein